jgi:thiamine-phosphate pyrophosphorylase
MASDYRAVNIASLSRGMVKDMLRYAITDRTAYPGSIVVQKDALETQAARLSQDGVDHLQLREKDLPIHERVGLAIRLRAAILDGGGETKLFFNGVPSLAALAGADGVHLPGNLIQKPWRPVDFTANGRRMLVSVSCHTLADVDRARSFADVLLFAPIFVKQARGKRLQDGVGLDALREACHVAGSVPVLALGGVDKGNVAECIAAGAAGMAGVRAFV